MEGWSEKRLKDGNGRRMSENPSFSSTLLDAIYRSIDEKEVGVAGKKKVEGSKVGSFGKDDMVSFKRACMVEKKVATVRRNSVADLTIVENPSRKVIISSSSSSESSSGMQSLYGKSYRAPAACAMQFSRRERTCPEKSQDLGISHPVKKLISKQKSNGSSGKNETRVKQPLSPGGKLASFLNSLFAGNSKTKVKSPSSACSSASSMSRSCLNEAKRETPEAFANGGHLYPITVSRPCRASQDNKKFRLEVARDILRKFQKSSSHESLKKEDEEEKRSSCSSSDLFELENLFSIGINERFRKELPVYETAHLDSNLAIARGLRA